MATFILRINNYTIVGPQACWRHTEIRRFVVPCTSLCIHTTVNVYEVLQISIRYEILCAKFNKVNSFNVGLSDKNKFIQYTISADTTTTYNLYCSVLAQMKRADGYDLPVMLKYCGYLFTLSKIMLNTSLASYVKKKLFMLTLNFSLGQTRRHYELQVTDTRASARLLQEDRRHLSDGSRPTTASMVRALVPFLWRNSMTEPTSINQFSFSLPPTTKHDVTLLNYVFISFYSCRFYSWLKTSNKNSEQNRRDRGTTANKFLGYHSGSRSDCGLVGRDAVQSCKWIPKFRRDYFPGPDSMSHRPTGDPPEQFSGSLPVEPHLILAPFISTLKMVTGHFSETLASAYKAIQCHNSSVYGRHIKAP